jgi:excisionase family DNA binding protein
MSGDADRDDRLLLPARAAAARLSISERTLARLVARGEIASVEVGRRRLFAVEDLIAFIQERKAIAVA